jgi:predicted site-specific integrase-resolvase
MKNKPEITKIAPVSFSIISSSNGGKKRVCAYARVSTEKDSQRNSLEAQKSYYTKLIGNLISIY